MSKFMLLVLFFFSNLCWADGASYGGMHEIAIDGQSGFLRHVHNWSSPEKQKIFLIFRITTKSSLTHTLFHMLSS